MKRSIYFLAFLFSCFQTKSQTQSVGFGTGATLYFGDLGNEKYVPLSEINHGFSLSLKQDLNHRGSTGKFPFAIEAQAEWLRIGYDETRALLFNGTSGTDLRNFRRGLNFKNDLIGVNAEFVWTISPWSNRPISDYGLAMYFFVGTGLYYSDPRADLFRGSIDPANRYYYWDDGTLRDEPRNTEISDVVQRDGQYETHLRQWFTEGESATKQPGRRKQYSWLQMGFPHGGGFKFGLSNTLTLQYEFAFYDFPFTDYIDDVSSRYATIAEIESNFPNDPEKQVLAKYITDPSGWGSDGVNGSSSSRRGNWRKFDWVYFMNLQLFFTSQVKVRSYHAKHHRTWGNPKI